MMTASTSPAGPSLADIMYGPLTAAPSLVTTAAAANPAAVQAPTRAEHAPSRPLAGEAGHAAKATSARSVMDNPATWLVVSIGAAIALARYAASGRLL